MSATADDVTAALAEVADPDRIPGLARFFTSLSYATEHLTPAQRVHYRSLR